jgi:hypothetical protein
MLRYEELKKHPRKFLAMTGYTVAEFEALLPHFQAEFEKHVAIYRLDGKKRSKRSYSAYKNSPLPTVADKLLFILIYLKQGSLQEAQATLFGLHQPDANKWIHLLQMLLNRTLAVLAELPARETAELEQRLEAEAKEKDKPLLFLHDGTERTVVRPKDKSLQKLYYSGKKRSHTLKNILLSQANCKIIFLSPTCEGKKHDKKAADQASYQLPAGSTLYQDTGFQGFSLVGVTIIQPKKKPRAQELTEAEKQNNRLISKIRVRIEHVIGGVKRYRIVKDKIRAWKANFRDKVMETCCGLHNFRLNFRPWLYIST